MINSLQTEIPMPISETSVEKSQPSSQPDIQAKEGSVLLQEVEEKLPSWQVAVQNEPEKVIGEISKIDEVSNLPEAQLDPITEALKDFPKDEQMTIVVGQHGIEEPIALAVGKKIAKQAQSQNKPVKSQEFPQGHDYSDFRQKARETGTTYEAIYTTERNSGVVEMAKIATENNRESVINMHESTDPWESDNSYIELKLPSRLTVLARSDIKQLSDDINRSIAGLGITIGVSGMDEKSDADGRKDAYNTIGPNMLVVEIHTPISLYDKVDETIPDMMGNTKLKEDPISQAKVAELTERYTSALGELLPVINSKFKELHSNSKNDMLTYDPSFTGTQKV